MTVPPLPDGARLVRTTPELDVTSVPRGLQRSHRIAEGVWGRLVVHAGSVRLVFEDDEDDSVTVDAGATAVIPPGRLHHVVLGEGARFAIEFHRDGGPDPA